jgi:hypothetical protein
VYNALFHGSRQQDKRMGGYEGKTVQVRSSWLALMSIMSDGEIALSMSLRHEIAPGAAT